MTQNSQFEKKVTIILRRAVDKADVILTADLRRECRPTVPPSCSINPAWSIRAGRSVCQVPYPLLQQSTYAKEFGAKSSQITTLENSLNNVTRYKNAFFEQLQLRQAELESAQAHLESIQHQNTEFSFQSREANDRVALLKEE